MIIPTTDNITKFHTFTAQNWLRNVRHIMCLLLVLPLIACGGDGTGTGSSNDVVLDPTFVAYLETGDLTLNNFLKTDTGKAVGEDDHLRRDLGLLYSIGGITDLAIEAGTEADTIKITVKEQTSYLGVKEEKTGPVETLSYTDPDPKGRFVLKEGTDEWGQGLFSSNRDGSTVMGLVSKDKVVVEYTGNAWAVTGKEYVWYDIAKQSGMYTFGGKNQTTAVGYEQAYETSQSGFVTDQDNDVWFAMTLNIPTAAAAASLPSDADAILSITDWHFDDVINAADKNFLPLPALVSLKGGVGSSNLRLVEGDAVNYIDDRFLNFGTYKDASDRLSGKRKGLPFDKSKKETMFYKEEVVFSSISARLYGELGSLANKKAVIAGTYSMQASRGSGDDGTNWGVYVLKQQ